MQDSNKSNSSDDDFSYFDVLLSYYHSIVWKPSRFHRRHNSLEKIIARTNQTAKFLNKIKLRQLACTTRAKSIPENTTIREEYVKCGREFCGELHGPWKDPEVKKLKKKYICTYLSPAKDKPELLKNGAASKSSSAVSRRLSL